MLYNAHFVLNLVVFQLKLRELFTIVEKKFFITPPGKTGSTIQLKLFSDIHLLLKVFCFEAFVNCIAGKGFMNKSTSRCDFDEKYFYRLLLAINYNIDFIVNSIDFRYNMDNKTFMQSSGINVFIGAYQQLIAMLILLFQYNIYIVWTIKQLYRANG